jgi:mRNA interferase RelE/StbE
VHATRLTDSRLGSFRFRIGDWRVVFDIIDDRVMVLRIGHRREIYR